MAAANSSTGMGQGAAQVFGQSPAVAQYINGLRNSVYQQQQEAVMLERMLSSFSANTGKMRPQDIGEFNQKYSELKSLYSSNKGLYKTPAKYPELYQRSIQLQGELRQMVTESIQQNEHLKSITQARLTNPDNFEDESVTAINMYGAAPTSAIKQSLGGSLFTPAHVQYQPKQYDWKKFGDTFHQFALDSNMAHNLVEDKKTGDGRIFVKEKTVYDPEAAMSFSARAWDTDVIYRKNMNRMANNATKQELDMLQAELDDYMGSRGRGSFSIDTPEKFAQAYAVLQFREREGTPKFMTDPKYSQDRQDARQGRAFENQKELIRYRKSLSKEEENKLEQDSIDIVKLVGTGDEGAIKGKLFPLFEQFSLKLGSTPATIRPNANTFEGFKQQAKKWNDKVYKGNRGFKLSDAEIAEAYKNNEAIMAIEIVSDRKDANDKPVREKEYLLIRGVGDSNNKTALKTSAMRVLQLLKASGAGEKTGARIDMSESMNFDVSSDNGDW